MSCSINTRCKDMLDEMYKNVKMGVDAIVDIMPKVKDDGLRGELTAQLEKYGSFTQKIEDILHSDGCAPKEEGFITKISSKMGIAMNTMMDDTTSHLAQMIIEGATMGITNMTRLLRENENTSCSEEILTLARDIIKYEESTVENMKKYL